MATAWLREWKAAHPLQWSPAHRPAGEVLADQAIPRLIMQCGGALAGRNSTYVRTWIELNQEYDHVYLTDTDGASFVETSAAERERAAYASLLSGAARADMLRLLFLRELGGVYADTDMQLRTPLRELIPRSASAVTTPAWSFEFLAFEPRHPFIVAAVANVTQNVLTQVCVVCAPRARAPEGSVSSSAQHLAFAVIGDGAGGAASHERHAPVRLAPLVRHVHHRPPRFLCGAPWRRARARM